LKKNLGKKDHQKNKNMKIVRESLIKESYNGAGYSYMSGFKGGMGGITRGGFGGALNMGGYNSMYTYEVKPLNHTLEQPPARIQYFPQISVGSKIYGFVVPSNAYPDGNKIVIGTVYKIVKTPNNNIKYYIVLDQNTQKLMKVEPTRAKLITFKPTDYHYNANNFSRSTYIR